MFTVFIENKMLLLLVKNEILILKFLMLFLKVFSVLNKAFAIFKSNAFAYYFLKVLVLKIIKLRNTSFFAEIRLGDCSPLIPLSNGS